MDNNKITIGEVIGLVDNLYPNIRTSEEKKLWLNNIDTMIYEEIICTHEGYENIEFNGYTDDTSNDTELLAPKHYGAEMYRYFLQMQIDLANAEYTRYNVSSALFQSAYENYAKAYNRANMPLQPKVERQRSAHTRWCPNAI